MFKKEYLTIPNFLSISRALFLPILIVFAVKDMRLAFLVGYIILGSTDFFDGKIARRFNQKTDIGKTLDSVADLFFYIASAYFLSTLYPAYLSPNSTLLIIFFSILLLSFIVSAILCKKPIMMHTSLLRFNAVLVYLVVILSYFMNTTYFIAGILILYLIAFTEEIIIFIKYGEVDPDSKSIFHIQEKVKKK
ncbi:MAG: CDP-alcohol phosphatidyltransferase family protein [Clostridiales bacterium]|nr:CDP-alcohol phosphatidyltransferase family protein [Clostridiales bacterium]